uniref:Uncharacterized protein n=1 Tax=Timema cristinae TaxID=61476 RepID=A0A7R9GZE1_TIMCR|nr:unnamed protein product [Timema cristinae]
MVLLYSDLLHKSMFSDSAAFLNGCLIEQKNASKQINKDERRNRSCKIRYANEQLGGGTTLQCDRVNVRRWRKDFPKLQNCISTHQTFRSPTKGHHEELEEKVTQLCEFESSSPPPLLGRSSVGAKPYIGSRSNITSKLSVAPRDGGSQQCYMGISLPRVLSDLYPAADKPVVDKKRSARWKSQKRALVLTLRDLTGPSKAHLRSTSSHHRHVSTHCLSCWRLRDRKISTGSHHWYRTDTDSSVGGGDSPVLVPRRRKSHSTGSGVLCLTPGGSLDSNKSLDAGSSLPAEEQDTILSKSLTRKQILRHVGRMSNPVWGKQSRQALLQSGIICYRLKQKFPSSFQDVCLYSEVCHRMSVASYRLVARRFIQELFLDLTFDMLYDEPASILQMENTSVATSSPLHGQEVTEVPSALVKSPPLEVVREEAPSLESCVYSVLSVEGVGSSRQSNRSTRTNIVSSSEDAFKVSPNYNISNVNSLSGVVGDPLCSETTKISSDRSSTDTDIPNTSFLIAEDINKNTLESISCRYLNKDQSTSCSNPGSVEPTAGTKPRTLSRATEVNTLKLFETNSSPQQTVQSKHLQSLYEFESAINTVVKAKNLELWNTPHSDNIGVGINNVRNMSGDSCVVESDVSKERCVFVDLMGAGDGSSEDCNVQVPLLVITTTAFIAPVFDNTATCVVSNPRTGSSTPQGAPRRDHISPRNRKLATSLPPNISTLAKTSSNLVPTCIASTIAKNVHQVPILPPSESQTKSGESVHNKK